MIMDDVVDRMIDFDQIWLVLILSVYAFIVIVFEVIHVFETNPWLYLRKHCFID